MTGRYGFNRFAELKDCDRQVVHTSGSRVMFVIEERESILLHKRLVIYTTAHNISQNHCIKNTLKKVPGCISAISISLPGSEAWRFFSV